MKLSRVSIFLLAITMFLPMLAFSQDSVSVTFRYTPNDGAVRAFVPGEFNDFGNNSSGRIAIDNESLMEEDTVAGFWFKTIKLEIGSGPSTHNGANGWRYKFHEQYNSTGTEWEWFTDPLNPITVGSFNDSFVEVGHPMIFQLGSSSSQIFDENSEIWATVASIDTDSIDIAGSQYLLNGAIAGTFEGHYDTSRQLFYLTDLASENLLVGENTLTINAETRGGETATATLEFSYFPDIEPEKQARPAGLEDGITYHDNGSSVTVSLFAPGKDYVFAIGDFNDWAATQEYLLKEDSLNADSTWFWLTIDGLTPGEEYGFQYLVDGEIKIADPYSKLILDPYNDEFILDTTFPNLKAYPEGKTTEIVTLLQPGKEDYQWNIENFNKPAKEDLIVYELLIRDFLADHSFNTLKDTLDYLQNLGINAIELMPVSEFDGNESWGYNPAFHLALDKYYGSPNAFKAFIDEAHSRGMAVILDVVLNHATGANPLYRLYSGNNPYFNAQARHSYNVFNDFNHQYSGTQYYTERMIEYWISEYKIDGFRWDLTKGFTQNCSFEDDGCTNNYQSDRVEILKKYADVQWSLDPDFYVIHEHLGNGGSFQEEIEWANYRVDEGKGIMFWGKANAQYNQATMGYRENSDLSAVLNPAEFQEQRRIGYMESHDEQWLMFKNLSFGNQTEDKSYNVQDLNTALGRMKQAGAFFFLLPGPKMIWQFGEVGYGYGNSGEQCLRPGDGSLGICPTNSPGRVSPKPIRWDYFNDPDTIERRKLYHTWSALINLRKSSSVFTNPDNITYSLSNVYKRIVLEHSDTDAVIVGNFDVVPRGASGDFTQTGTWYDFFEGTEINVTDVNQTVSLEPGEFKIFTTKAFETPTNTERDIELPQAFEVSQNYPNPFNPGTNIQFQLPEAGEVSIQVYSVHGQKVMDLSAKRYTAGSHQVYFNASQLSSGVYFARISFGRNTETIKMTLIK